MQALPASLTAPARIDCDTVALGDSARAGPERGHRAGGLVAKSERQRKRHCTVWPLHHVQIAVAEAGGGHFQQHLAGARRGDGDFGELGLAPPAM